MLSLLAKAEYPDAPLDFQLQIGWLALLCATLILLWAWTRAESLRRAFFAREDPRLFALFRIGLGLITIQNFWNLNMHWRMLWTDEGLFTAAETHKRLGRAALKGWTEVDGFFDGWAVAKFFWGKYSLLFINSEPGFVQLYLALLIVVLVLFTIGFRARVTAVVAMLMVNSLYNRNAVYLEGHDTVFRCLWFMVLFARTDAAWSVDNWLRRRREARLAGAIAGGAVPYDWRQLADRAGHWLWGGLWALLFCLAVDFSPRVVLMVVLAGVLICAVVGVFEREHRRALADAGKLEPGEPVRFRLIPAWPRYLFIAQLICLYSATGLYKTGSVWKRGDALYYALNMDHFYRFEVLTQWASVYLAANLFRVMTVVTLYWEKLFVLVAVGLILGWSLRHRDEPWYRAMEAVWWRKWLGRLSLVGAYVVVYRVVTLAYPWCLALQKDKTPQPAEPGLTYIRIWFLAVIPALVLAWHALGRWPIPVGRLIARLSRGRLERVKDAKIDQQFVRDWVFGRRIWLGLGVIFHGILLVFMNIGMFPVIMMWFYPTFFQARPFLRAGRWLRDKARAHKLTKVLAPRLLDEALDEGEGVLETPAQSLRRDPTGPWWLDPQRLLFGAALLVRERKREALVRVVERGRERGGRMPDALVLALGAVGVVLASLRGLEAKTEDDAARRGAQTQFVGSERTLAREQRQAEAEAREDRLERLGDAGHWWVYAGLVFAAVSHFRRRPAMDRLPEQETTAAPEPPLQAEDEPEDEPRPTLARPQLIGGTLMRTIVLGFTFYHCAAIGVTFIPRYPITEAWRSETIKVFGDYVRGINLRQSWKMFAPNPPRRNTFMRTVVIDTDGNPYQVGKDHYTQRPYVFWYNDRERKMHRRMVGKSKWYLRYWSQYHCRDWAFNNDGHLPEEVRIFKLRTPIPKPEELIEAGVASDPRKRPLRTELVETHKCKPDHVTPIMKQRRGWELSEDELEELEREAKQLELSAEAKRKQWDRRERFGGESREQREDD